MNKIHTINLGGTPFTVDEDALEYLQAYIRSLKKHFKNSPGCEEIISDIESRLAELMTERMEGKQIVSLREVKEVISVMGSPEEFGADPIDEKIIDPNRKRSDHTGRRLFRDPDDKIIAGVCSGLAAYFGINDPVWVRLVFGLMMFGGGITVPLYIILRIIMPKADSAADRLAMKGEPIDYKSIAKTIQDEIEHLSSEFSTMDTSEESMKRQWDATTSVAGKGIKAGAGVLAWFFSILGLIIRNVVPFVLKFAAVIAIIFMSMIFIGLIFGWSVLWPYAPRFVAGPKIFSALSMMNMFFIGLIPLVFGLFFVARVYNGTRLPKSFAAGLGGLWLLNVLSGSMIGINTARQFSNHAEINRTIYEGKLNTDVLKIEQGEVKDRDDMFTLFGEAWLDDGKLIHPRVPVHIQESSDDQFHITQNNIAKGESSTQAKMNAQNLGSVARIDGNNLYINNFIELEKNEKMRDQHSSIFISVPIGKKVQISDKIYPIDGQRDESQSDSWEMGGKTWTMTKKGLFCPELEVKKGKIGENAAPESIGETIKQIKETVQEVKERIKEEVKNEEN
jgi:phage shock protein PspC (stress-responsive transcriptional regulator)